MMIYDHSLEVLLDGSNQSMYWIGYIAADGSFYKNTLSIHSVDYNHLEMFKDYIKSNHPIKPKKTKGNGKTVYSINVSKKNIIYEIMKRFNFNYNKTYNPPNLSLTGDELIYFLIGFIDGDGCIFKTKNGKYPVLSIKNHRSWFNVLKFISEQLKLITGTKTPHPSIIGSGYAVLRISKSKIINFLKLKTTSIKVMGRKWNKINIDRPKKQYEKVNEVFSETVIQLFFNGCGLNEAAKLSGICVESIKKRLKTIGLKYIGDKYFMSISNKNLIHYSSLVEYINNYV